MSSHEFPSRSPLRILYLSFNMPWRGGGTFYRVMGFAQHLAHLGHHLTILATSPDQKYHFTELENPNPQHPTPKSQPPNLQSPISNRSLAIDNSPLLEFPRVPRVPTSSLLPSPNPLIPAVPSSLRLILSPALLPGRLRTGWDLYEVIRRCQWLRGRSFDLIHGFESRPIVIYPALYAQKHYHAPLILDWCDWFGRGGSVEQRTGLTKLLLRPVETFYEEHFRTRAQGTTVINTPLRRRALDLGVPADTIHWLPNGAELDQIRPTPQHTARQTLNLPQSTYLIGHLGQAFPDDAALMAAAFRLVQAARPDVRLLLIGNHKTDIAAYLDATPAVLETGYITPQQLNLYLAACDLLWLPLRDTLANRGRWPMKINDYMSSGRPIISTPVGDLTQLFQQPHPIGLLAADNPTDFAQQTLTLLADQPARLHYGQNGRHHAQTTFAWPLVTAQLEQFYYDILSQTGTHRNS
jgi:glycosyltransferase involved in cell wall biosynthesis